MIRLADNTPIKYSNQADFMGIFNVGVGIGELSFPANREDKSGEIVIQTILLLNPELADALRLGACAIGVEDIDLFAKMTGLAFHVEGSVGQIAIGRGAQSDSPPVAD